MIALAHAETIALKTLQKISLCNSIEIHVRIHPCQAIMQGSKRKSTMRKIEISMNAAIESTRADVYKGKDESSKTFGNTRVVSRRRDDSAVVTSVFLHGNLICQYSSGLWGFKMCGWATPTTKSRINAICQENGLARVNTKKGQMYHGTNPIDAHAWFWG